RPLPKNRRDLPRHRLPLRVQGLPRRPRLQAPHRLGAPLRRAGRTGAGGEHTGSGRRAPPPPAEWGIDYSAAEEDPEDDLAYEARDEDEAIPEERWAQKPVDPFGAWSQAAGPSTTVGCLGREVGPPADLRSRRRGPERTGYDESGK